MHFQNVIILLHDFPFKFLLESPDFNYEPSVTPTTSTIDKRSHSKFT